MTKPVITVVCFFALAVILLLVNLLEKHFDATTKKFLSISSAIYFSATILIGIIVFLNQEMDYSFALISEISILFFHIVTSCVIIKLIKTFGEISNATKKDGNVINEDSDKEQQ